MLNKDLEKNKIQINMFVFFFDLPLKPCGDSDLTNDDQEDDCCCCCC